MSNFSAIMSAERPASVGAGNRTKVSRKSITLDVKMQVLRQIEAGERQVEVGRAFDLATSTIRTILSNADKIKASARSTTSLSKTKLTRSRSSLSEKMESRLIVWMEEQTRRQMPLTQSVIMEKARSIFTHLREQEGERSTTETFAASRGWFDRFKRRSNFHGGGISREAPSADHQAALELCFTKSPAADIYSGRRSTGQGIQGRQPHSRRNLQFGRRANHSLGYVRGDSSAHLDTNRRHVGVEVNTALSDTAPIRTTTTSVVTNTTEKPVTGEVYTALSDTAAPIRTTTTSVTNTTEEPVTDDGHSMPKSWKRKRTLNNEAKSQSEDINEMQNKPEMHETFSRVRLKPQKLKENVLQPKSSHDKQLGLDLSFPMLINDIGSFLEIAEKLISDYSTRIKQTVNAHVGASHIIHSPLQKTVGTQTDGRCFCNNIEKLPGRPKAKYEKKVLQLKIEVDMGKNQVQPRRKPSKKRKNVLETSDSENKRDVVKPSHKAPKKTPADSENTPLDVVKPGRRTPKRSKKIINTPSASENSPMDVVLNSRRLRGSIRPIPAWLENQGVAAEALQAVITGLGTEILGVLCARAQPTTARVQLCSLAAQTFTTTMYAELCRFMESCSAPQGSEQAIVSRCQKDVEEMGGSPGVLEIKVEYEDSFPEEKKDLKDDMYFGLSSSTGWR
uniref:HTH CENPB-type domain-containing protein n=1 Tax=Eptatretus burgeri TaxID=7764 RepID=A0A8C4PZS8_EPTBU